MTFAAGTRLGPYEIVAPIGAGGMGEVFRGRDTRLDRSVAIKVLSAHLSAHPDLRERFDREARAISSLSHPHICALYDVGHQDGVDYLVMEYLEGETLADRLSRGPLSIEQVLKYGAQIAEALERAHKAGIVHRDLKPGNVMITRSGAKLLDFGLAKTAGMGGEASATTALATEQKPLTAEGTILGTFQYMAPEQIEGREADHRTDIFAFGALLYEMATGKRAFEAKSKASLIASILDREPPPISTIQPLTPAGFERVVKQCLAKDPDERWQSAHDVASELKWVGEATGAPADKRRGRRALLPWLVSAALAAALVGVTVMNRRTTVERPLVRFAVPPPEKASWTPFNSLSISPDGKFLVFFAAQGDPAGLLFVRRIDSLVAQPLQGTEDASFPFWSPDSRSVGFFVPGKLKRIDIGGGPPQTICDAPDGRGGTWSRDGVILFAPSPNSIIHRVPARGGVATPVLARDERRGERSQDWPTFLPDGQRFLYRSTLKGEDVSTIHIASIDSKQPLKTLVVADAAALAPPDHLLFLRQGTAFAQRFNLRTLKLEGDELPIAESLGFNPVSGFAAFACSNTGTLIYRGGGVLPENKLAWFDRTGKQLEEITPAGYYGDPALSPDGRKVAYFLASPGLIASDIWITDLGRRASTRLTFDRQAEVLPHWSADGIRVAYSAGPAREQQIVQKLASGVGGQTVLIGGRDKLITDWSDDGRYVIFDQRRGETKWDVVAADLTNGTEVPVAASLFQERGGSLSPDGRWIVYGSMEGHQEQPEIFIQPFPPTGGRWQVSSNGGLQPRWSRKGDEVFYFDLEANFRVVKLAPSSDGLNVSSPEILFRIPIPPGQLRRFGHYDVAPDGQRFLIATLAQNAASAPITVVLNWTDHLER